MRNTVTEYGYFEVNLVFASLKLGNCWACWKGGRRSFSSCTSFKLIHIPLQFSELGEKLPLFLNLQMPQALLSASDILQGLLLWLVHQELWKTLQNPFIYTYSKLPFFFLHRLIIKIAVNNFCRWDLPIYLNFVCACCLCPLFFNSPTLLSAGWEVWKLLW